MKAETAVMLILIVAVLAWMARYDTARSADGPHIYVLDRWSGIVFMVRGGNPAVRVDLSKAVTWETK